MHKQFMRRFIEAIDLMLYDGDVYRIHRMARRTTWNSKLIIIDQNVYGCYVMLACMQDSAYLIKARN